MTDTAGQVHPPTDPEARPSAGVDLYWLPLGAGGHFVRFNGRVFEGVAARLAHRSACDLYHSALEVRTPDGRFEAAPSTRPTLSTR